MPQFRQEHLEFATAGLVGKLLCVITVKEIEAEIEKLPTEDLLKLAKWIDERVGPGFGAFFLPSATVLSASAPGSALPRNESR